MSKSKRQPNRRPAVRVRARSGPSRGLVLGVVVLVVVAVGVLYLVFRAGNSANTANGGTARFQVGSPGIGQTAPAFTLASASGGTVSLSAYRGKTVLLYFHEGLGCQPCWDQIRGLEQDWPRFTAAGVDDLVTITTGAANLIAQKMHDDGLSATALSDPDLSVSQAYHANQYGMMGTGADGHTFILVGPNGVIQWRADYGGAPNYTMYVKPAQLLDDLRARRTS